MATFFADQIKFREWLEKNHRTASELVVGFYKVNSGKPSMTWSESVDQALCFGWIDGVRRSLDKESYTIRFTPRRPNSIWSTINIQKMEVLTKAGFVKAEGLQAFALRKEEKSNIYSHEKENIAFTPALEAHFRKNTAAWAFFTNQAPSYTKVITHWIMSAKKEETRLSRLEKTILASEQQKRLEKW